MAGKAVGPRRISKEEKKLAQEVAQYTYLYHMHGSFGTAEAMEEAEHEMEKIERRWRKRYGYRTSDSIIRNIKE